MNITQLLHQTGPSVDGQDVEKTPALDQNSHMFHSEDERKLSSSIDSSHYDGSPVLPRMARRSKPVWDANGYSMPPGPSMVKPSPQSEQAAVPLYSLSEEAASPSSPKHRFSDSQSTLASYASQSTRSHSRFSSISTTGYEQGIGIARDDFSPKLGPLFGAPDIAGDKEEPNNYGYTIPLATDPTIRAHKRTTSAPDPSSANLLYPPSNYQHTGPGHIFNTKTKSSEMENPGIGGPTTPMPPLLNYGPVNPITPLHSHAPVNTITPLHNHAPINPTTNYECMHNDRSCDLKSVLRKAISHIFGRNKVCTRMIPEHIWVHLCRKHYQRSRYRSGHEYTQRQCDLIIEQIHRIHDWSEENKAKGDPAVNRGWKLDMRKREKKRVEENESKKRRYSETDMDDEGGFRDITERNGTAMPAWLRSKCGEGYSTDEILEIMHRLKHDIIEEKRNQMPDLEILPDIVPDSAEETNSRTPAKRQTPSYTAHKRSKSYSIGMRGTPYTPMVGQPMPSWRQENSPGFNVADRWRRTTNEVPSHFNNTEFRYDEAPSSDGSIMSHTPHPISNIPCRPAYHSSQGSSAEGSPDGPQYGGHDGRPVPRRFANTSALTAPEPNAVGLGRILHMRSVSEFSFPQSSFNPRMNEPSPQQTLQPIYHEQSFGTSSARNYSPTHAQDFPRPSTETNWPHPSPSYNPRETPKHTRHQSTPNPAGSYYSPHGYDNGQHQGNLAMNGHPQYTQRPYVPIYEASEPGKLGPFLKSKPY
ncbi:hypothetical protein O1611_g658 [Lasiodiplodia mahajangana]|uniref:Uncharacterized protein n=1 Tax=Lasiodiplodia mahajangana TaxID=1108764 RepID=A0ACC2JZZ0_9PEZI|nr:hypothetical protein O1611_g658 [Lasiodiplodia mahajangana]